MNEEMKSNLGGSTNVVFSFDCTGSMLPCIQQVRQNLRDLIKAMSADIPGLKVGLIAHGDYCDGPNCIHVLDLTTDLEKIMSFINDVPNVGGGDAPECYELALRTAKNLSWPEEGGSFVLIGDETPHEINPENIDWRQEMAGLKDKKVNVFAMQCLFQPNAARNAFWEEVSQIGDTPLLILESFNDSANVLAAVAHATAGEEHYERYLADMEAAPAPEYGGSASNVAENREKLRNFVNKSATTKKE